MAFLRSWQHDSKSLCSLSTSAGRTGYIVRYYAEELKYLGLGAVRNLLLFCLGVLAPKAFHASCRVHQLLFAGEKWVAIGANLDVDIAFVSRTSGKAVTACAHDANFIVCGMNACLHGSPEFDRDG